MTIAMAGFVSLSAVVRAARIVEARRRAAVVMAAGMAVGLDDVGLCHRLMVDGGNVRRIDADAGEVVARAFMRRRRRVLLVIVRNERHIGIVRGS